VVASDATTDELEAYNGESSNIELAETSISLVFKSPEVSRLITSAEATCTIGVSSISSRLIPALSFFDEQLIKQQTINNNKNFIII
jgi:hypothetical protein